REGRKQRERVSELTRRFRSAHSFEVERSNGSARESEPADSARCTQTDACNITDGLQAVAAEAVSLIEEADEAKELNGSTFERRKSQVSSKLMRVRARGGASEA
ncbi:MAG: hypothetical protein P4M11_02170, partial [Candidatus Pacebacteria bacterium]|nr:hypothetical protein [Candidatus Paceibacterota bacterium]